MTVLSDWNLVSQGLLGYLQVNTLCFSLNGRFSTLTRFHENSQTPDCFTSEDNPVKRIIKQTNTAQGEIVAQHDKNNWIEVEARTCDVRHDTGPLTTDPARPPSTFYRIRDSKYKKIIKLLNNNKTK